MAEHANIWHSFSDAETLATKLEVLAKHGADVGRDVSEIEISTELSKRSASDADELVELGAAMFTLQVSGPNHDLARVRDWLAWRDQHNRA